eukprot:4535052-Prymnesium_polylepis.1
MSELRRRHLRVPHHRLVDVVRLVVLLAELVVEGLGVEVDGGHREEGVPRAEGPTVLAVRLRHGWQGACAMRERAAASEGTVPDRRLFPFRPLTTAWEIQVAPTTLTRGA